jgi:hypothetical protein
VETVNWDIQTGYQYFYKGKPGKDLFVFD